MAGFVCDLFFSFLCVCVLFYMLLFCFFLSYCVFWDWGDFFTYRGIYLFGLFSFICIWENIGYVIALF